MRTRCWNIKHKCLFSGSPAGPAEPRSTERLSDDGQELVPPPSGEGRSGVSGQERSQVQSLRQRPGGAHRHQVRHKTNAGNVRPGKILLSDWLSGAHTTIKVPGVHEDDNISSARQV